jgi:hypothetical protein
MILRPLCRIEKSLYRQTGMFAIRAERDHVIDEDLLEKLQTTRKQIRLQFKANLNRILFN